MKNYGVLKGKAVDYKRDNDADPHSELLMDVDGMRFRIAINVRSSRGPIHTRLIEYLIIHDIRHLIVDHAREGRHHYRVHEGNPARDDRHRMAREHLGERHLAHLVRGGHHQTDTRRRYQRGWYRV